MSPFLQVQAVLKRKEEEDQQMKQVVQTLQLALEKEKTKVKDLKEQVGVLAVTQDAVFLLTFMVKCQLFTNFHFASQMIRRACNLCRFEYLFCDDLRLLKI